MRTVNRFGNKDSDIKFDKEEGSGRLTQQTFNGRLSYNFHLEETQDGKLPVIEDAINFAIKSEQVDTNLISDGYHTFGELYEHRIILFIKLCSVISAGIGIMKQLNTHPVWRTQIHSDGSVWEGWFLLGLWEKPGEQITYHLPMSKWDDCNFASTLDKAPEFDGHTSADVLTRLKTSRTY